jgi:hypothetical protein
VPVARPAAAITKTDTNPSTIVRTTAVAIVIIAAASTSSVVSRTGL